MEIILPGKLTCSFFRLRSSVYLSACLSVFLSCAVSGEQQGTRCAASRSALLRTVLGARLPAHQNRADRGVGLSKSFQRTEGKILSLFLIFVGWMWIVKSEQWNGNFRIYHVVNFFLRKCMTQLISNTRYSLGLILRVALSNVLKLVLSLQEWCELSWLWIKVLPKW